jgi:hypothetical protein
VCARVADVLMCGVPQFVRAPRGSPGGIAGSARSLAAQYLVPQPQPGPRLGRMASLLLAMASLQHATPRDRMHRSNTTTYLQGVGHHHGMDVTCQHQCQRIAVGVGCAGNRAHMSFHPARIGRSRSHLLSAAPLPRPLLYTGGRRLFLLFLLLLLCSAPEQQQVVRRAALRRLSGPCRRCCLIFLPPRAGAILTLTKFPHERTQALCGRGGPLRGTLTRYELLAAMRCPLSSAS